MRQLTLNVRGMTCAACASSIETQLLAQTGVKEAVVNTTTEQVRITFDPKVISIPTLIQVIESLGYEVPAEEVTFDIHGMTCAACSGRIERVLNKTDGIHTAQVNLALEKGTLSFDPSQVSVKEIEDKVHQLGFEATLPTLDATDHREEELTKKTRLFWLSLLFTLPLMWTMFSHFTWTSNVYVPDILLNPYVQWALATPVQFGIGWIFYRGAYYSLKNKSANMDVLVALGTSAAYLYSVYLVFTDPHHGLYFETSAMLITLILLGKVMEAKAKGKSSDAIQSLMHLQPATARVETEKGVKEVAIEDVTVGDLIRIRPGEAMPVDGVVVEGESSVDEAMLTGESFPQTKRFDDEVFAATINGDGTLLIRATAKGSDTVLASIIRTVEEAQGSKAPIQRLADEISNVFVPVVVTLSVLTFLVWYFFVTPGDFEYALRNAIAVLVIACPCALGLATPTSIMAGSGRAAEYGILFKTAEAMERTRQVNTVVFDKTGTLTKGTPEVVHFEVATPWTKEQVLPLVVSSEALSEHPLAQAIVRFAPSIQQLPVDHFEAVRGHGIQTNIHGDELAIGNATLFERLNIPLLNIREEWKREGATVVYVAINGVHVASLAIRDEVKPSAQKAVQTLVASGYDVYMLTGDDHITARTIAQTIGIAPNKVFSDVLPNDKAAMIEKLQKEKRTIAMIGDGLNDAPALATADIGIAMSSGTNVAMEAADITVMHDDMMRIPQTFEMSEKTVKNIHQNLFWALGYNSLGIPIAAAGLLAPWVAGAAMAFSSVSVVLNALRLQRVTLSTDSKEK